MFEGSLLGAVSSESFREIQERLESICGRKERHRCHMIHAVSKKEIKETTRLRITRMVRGDLTSENKWKMEYLGDPLSSRSFAGDSHPHLLHSVLFRPIHPSYVSPSPITALSALGFQVHSEFIREGFMYVKGNVVCLLTQIKALDKSSGTSSIIDASTWHVELSILISEGTDMTETGLLLVNFAQQLHPWVAFVTVNLRAAFAQQARMTSN